MSQTATVPEEEIAAPQPAEQTKPKPDQKTKRQPPYAVILHNDDLNSMDFVISVLRKVFNFERQKALRLMLEAHRTGRSIVWTGMLEVAELKADQVRSCGPDPIMKARGATTLKVTVEPLPS